MERDSMFEVTMPQLGETVADGTVTKWFKNVGDAVTRGEPLFEVSTDKVDTEIPAQGSGTLSAIYVDEGVTVDVGTLLALIGAEGESLPSAAPRATSPKATREAAGPAVSKARTSPEDGGKIQLSPVVRRLLAEHSLDASQVTGSGPNGRITREDVLAAAASGAQASSGEPAHGPLSPIVRRLLSEHNIDPASIAGSGPNGRITRHDVEVAIEKGEQPSAARRGDEVIPFTRIRRLTAEHMVRSKATSAHTLMVREIDYERVEVVRRTFGAAFKEREGFSLTYLPFNALAVFEALHEFPHLNASVGDNELIVHHDINLGVAVDLDSDGLVVPVVHNGDDYGLVAIARKVRELARLARNKKLTIDDMSNGTFTITNPGPFGTLLTGAVINQPQVAILATDGVTRKPVVVTSATGEESIAIHSVGLLALTFDHRAIDGAYAARFLSRVAEILNVRDWTSEF
jgi:2-oxoglutarate dehydrogenase E2 component (dihydrolipoamide succinyltransferase)